MGLFFDRYTGGEKSLLIHPYGLEESGSEHIAEFHDLALSSGVNIFDLMRIHVRKIEPRHFISKGKVEEVKQQVCENDVEVILFNHTLSPSQEKNLETALCCRVVDRIGLILDIFAQRARTHEGKLQVELAQLKHLSTRLVKGWTHLERQKGGIGLRGPGETQLETDRRLLRARIRTINARLDKVRKQRVQTRRSRVRAGIPQISIVGYTNAGKSTLFNQLTSSSVYVKDQLFATLDPTIRQLNLPHFGSVVLADTVGFIRHLPHTLVEAFRATLEEVTVADLILHVVDCSSETCSDNIDQVYNVLREIGACHIPCLYVYNKVDSLPETDAWIDRDEYNVPCRVWVSALQGDGLDLLQKAITEKITDNRVWASVMLRQDQGKIRAKLYSMGAVHAESITKAGDIVLEVCLPQQRLEMILGVQGEKDNPS